MSLSSYPQAETNVSAEFLLAQELLSKGLPEADIPETVFAPKQQIAKGQNAVKEGVDDVMSVLKDTEGSN